MPFEVRAVLIHGAPWFKGKDIAASLGYVNRRQAIRTHVDNEDKETLLALFQSVNANAAFPGDEQAEEIYVNESGVYALIMRSNKPHAHTFQKWVTKEVLPGIRQTGAYVQHAPAESARYPPLMNDGDGARKRILEDIREALRVEMQQHHVWSFSKKSRHQQELERVGVLLQGEELEKLDERDNVVRIVDFLQDRFESSAWKLHGRQCKNIYAVELKQAKLRECRDEGSSPPGTFNQSERRIVYTDADYDLMVQVYASCAKRFAAIIDKNDPGLGERRRGQRSIIDFMQARRGNAATADEDAEQGEVE